MFRRHFAEATFSSTLRYVNQFQNQFSRIWNRLKPKVSGFFEYFALKTGLETGFVYLKPVYTRKYSKM